MNVPVKFAAQAGLKEKTPTESCGLSRTIGQAYAIRSVTNL